VGLPFAETKTAPKIPLGKDTTYANGPLDNQGYVDYGAALEARLRRGIKPQDNANAILWKTFVPSYPNGSRIDPEYFKRLGIAAPPQKGNYFVEWDTYGKKKLKLDKKQMHALEIQFNSALASPWKAAMFPNLASWISANEKALGVALEASKKPNFYSPNVAPFTKRGRGKLLDAKMPCLYNFRDITLALVARGLLHAGESKFDLAWQDLLAASRLARLIGQGSTLVEAQFCFTLHAVVTVAQLKYLESAQLNSKNCHKQLADLLALSELPRPADKVGLGERFIFLDLLQHVRRDGPTALLEAEAKDPDPKVLLAMEKADWAFAFRLGNKWHDRMVAAMRQNNYAKRQKLLDEINNELKRVKDARVKKEILNPEKLGQAYGEIVTCQMLMGIRPVQDSADRAEQRRRNLHIAFAIAAFRQDHGKGPARLGELVPKYLKGELDDLFTGKPLRYRQSNDQIFFYSFGTNGKDDDGRTYGDNPPGDDLTVRLKLPAPKPKK
jgi:hypothetical protein